MSYETMRLEVDEDGVAHLTLARGEQGNAMDERLLTELCEVSVELGERPEVRAVLLCAEGRAFGYGADIDALLDDGRPVPTLIKLWTARLHMAIARMQRLDAPVVAAVHGACAGGWAAFVAGCDLVVAGPRAVFVAAYTGIGFSPDGGGTVALSRRVGLARARRWFLLNERMDAGEALDSGLADEVAADDDPRARALELARRLAAGPTRTYGETRRLLLSAQHLPLEAQLELEAQSLARMASTADAMEGLTAFREKRPPRFEGR
jgi:2-(1,2-epoxy-1,2-dihydrophenyl)acetyl-CoA isomerase